MFHESFIAYEDDKDRIEYTGAPGGRLYSWTRKGVDGAPDTPFGASFVPDPTHVPNEEPAPAEEPASIGERRARALAILRDDCEALCRANRLDPAEETIVNGQKMPRWQAFIGRVVRGWMFGK